MYSSFEINTGCPSYCGNKCCIRSPYSLEAIRRCPQEAQARGNRPQEVQAIILSELEILASSLSSMKEAPPTSLEQCNRLPGNFHWIGKRSLHWTVSRAVVVDRVQQPSLTCGGKQVGGEANDLYSLPCV